MGTFDKENFVGTFLEIFFGEDNSINFLDVIGDAKLTLEQHKNYCDKMFPTHYLKKEKRFIVECVGASSEKHIAYYQDGVWRYAERMNVIELCLYFADPGNPTAVEIQNWNMLFPEVLWEVVNDGQR